mmetsp:Transcript_9106/g.17849  ORF Transcript_9106/g.17849 Transcript_9106/m.17849 type:complete len:484 (+) Transcript_9106:1-1452(+)
MEWRAANIAVQRLRHAAKMKKVKCRPKGVRKGVILFPTPRACHLFQQLSKKLKTLSQRKITWNTLICPSIFRATPDESENVVIEKRQRVLEFWAAALALKGIPSCVFVEPGYAGQEGLVKSFGHKVCVLRDAVQGMHHFIDFFQSRAALSAPRPQPANVLPQPSTKAQKRKNWGAGLTGPHPQMAPTFQPVPFQATPLQPFSVPTSMQASFPSVAPPLTVAAAPVNMVKILAPPSPKKTRGGKGGGGPGLPLSQGQLPPPFPPHAHAVSSQASNFVPLPSLSVPHPSQATALPSLMPGTVFTGIPPPSLSVHAPSQAVGLPSYLPGTFSSHMPWMDDRGPPPRCIPPPRPPRPPRPGRRQKASKLTRPHPYHEHRARMEPPMQHYPPDRKEDIFVPTRGHGILPGAHMGGPRGRQTQRQQQQPKVEAERFGASKQGLALGETDHPPGHAHGPVAVFHCPIEYEHRHPRNVKPPIKQTEFVKDE